MATDSFGLVGTTIDGRYLVEVPVGEGGFGVVYRGRHLAFKHDIAIKCLKVPSHFTESAQELFFEKFREEGRVLSRLSEHPAIVRVFDLNVTTNARGSQVPYLVLEWLEGDELERVLAARRKRELPGFSEHEAVELLRPAVEALALAHEERIAHRDVKPANIFVARTKNGVRVKVLDFGIAKAMQEGESATQMSTKTSSGFHAFSPQYGAPEQFRSKRYGATGPWTDIHALGLILSELTSGRPALEGEEMADFLESGTAPERPTPRARGAQVSDAFEALCKKALALDPRERFQDASELRRALEALPIDPSRPRRELAELVDVAVDRSVELGPTDEFVSAPERRDARSAAPVSGKTEHAEPIAITPPEPAGAAAAPAPAAPAAPSAKPGAARAPLGEAEPRSVGSDEVAAARRAFDASRARNLKIGGAIFGAVLLGVGGLIAANHYGDMRDKERFGVAWANLEECAMGGPLGDSEALPQRMKKIRFAQMSLDEAEAESEDFPGRCLKYVRAAQSSLRDIEKTPSKLSDRLKAFGEFIEEPKIARDMSRYAVALQALLDEAEAAKVERGKPESGVPKAPTLSGLFAPADLQRGKNLDPNVGFEPLPHLLGRKALVRRSPDLGVCASSPFECVSAASAPVPRGSLPVSFAGGKLGALLVEGDAMSLRFGEKTQPLCDGSCFFAGSDGERAYVAQVVSDRRAVRVLSVDKDGAKQASAPRSFLAEHEQLAEGQIAAVGDSVFAHIRDEVKDETQSPRDRVVLFDVGGDKPPVLFGEPASFSEPMQLRSCRAGDRTYAFIGDGGQAALTVKDKGGAWSEKRSLDVLSLDGCDATRAWGRNFSGLFVCDAAQCASHALTGTGCFDGAAVHEVNVIDSAVFHETAPLGQPASARKKKFLVDMAGRGVDRAWMLCAPGGTFVVLDLGQSSKLIQVGADGGYKIVE